MSLSAVSFPFAFWSVRRKKKNKNKNKEMINKVTTSEGLDRAERQRAYNATDATRHVAIDLGDKTPEKGTRKGSRENSNQPTDRSTD